MMIVLLSLLLTAAPDAAPPALTLERARGLALDRNVLLRGSRLQVRAAEADVVHARSALLPRLDLEASAERARSTGGEVTGSFVDPATGRGVPLELPAQTVWSLTGAVSVQQPLFDGGKAWHELAASRLGLDAARQGLEEARLETVFLVERRFYELVLAEHQLQVLADAAQRSREQAAATQRLFDAGRQTQADVYSARTNRDHDELNRLAQEARVEVVRQELAVAVGAEPGEPVTIEDPAGLLEDPAPPPPLEDAIGTALKRRPELEALSHTAESHRRAADAAAGEYWPALSLIARYQRQTQDARAFASRLDRAGTLSAGVLLRWNLFDGFATSAQVSKARVEAQQAENELSGARSAVAAEVAEAVEQLRVACQLAVVAAQDEGNARETLRMARARQEVGAGSQLEVRDAELKLTQARLGHVSALVGGRVAEAALRRALGGT